MLQSSTIGRPPALLAVCLGCVLAFGSASCRQRATTAPAPEIAVIDPNQKPAATDIYLDFTESMKGFVAASEGAPNVVEGWESGCVHFTLLSPARMVRFSVPRWRPVPIGWRDHRCGGNVVR